jgi:hypothetical protein
LPDHRKADPTTAAGDALYERVHDVVEQTLRRVLGPSDQELLDLVQEGLGVE